MAKLDTSCLLCGGKNVHPCGDDFMCNRCCNNVMASEEKYMFKWLENVVIPYAIKTKRSKHYTEEMLSVAKGVGIVFLAFVVMMILYRLFPHIF